MLDARTGGGHDSLEPGGRNRSQGAQSTLAAISVPQQGRRLSAARV